MRALLMILAFILLNPELSHAGRYQSFSLLQTKTDNNNYINVLSEEPIPTNETFTSNELLPKIRDFVDTPEGAIDWKLLGQTKQTPYHYKDEDGMDWEGVLPEFSEELKALDNQEITIKGFMFPLGQEEKQSLFLLGPFPMSCPYHYHVTPNLIIEVHASEKLKFSFDAVTIKGKLELVPRDEEYNVFYRLKNAHFE